jgi:hypothetical protein
VNEEELFAAAWACADDCDTCWYLCSDQQDIPGADVIVKLRAHLASGHRTTSEDDVR